MPTKPPKPCNYPGCPKLTFGRYCPEHEKLVNKKYEKTRETAVKRGYNTRWRKLRKMVLNEKPICEECERVPATEVHHLNGDSRDNRMENLQPLCKSCHSKTGVKDGVRWKRKN